MSLFEEKIILNNAVKKNYNGVEDGYESMSGVIKDINKNIPDTKIPKFPEMKEDETTEATASGSAGGFVPALSGEMIVSQACNTWCPRIL